jgi:hypothetical protein
MNIKEVINNKPKQSLSNDILMRSIKIIDIGYITVLYIAFSLFCAKITDKVMGKFDEKKELKKSKFRLTIELIIAVWLYGVLIYVVRNIVEIIPFPLDNFHGFSHKKVKELNSAMVFTFTFVLFSSYLKHKLSFYYNIISV